MLDSSSRRVLAVHDGSTVNTVESACCLSASSVLLPPVACTSRINPTRPFSQLLPTSQGVCAQVLDWELQRQLVPHMRDLQPLPGIYDADFIAANQDARADNIIKGSRAQQVETVRGQIRAFQADTGVDKVIVLWTANTERFAEVRLAASCSGGVNWASLTGKSLQQQCTCRPAIIFGSP